MTFRNMMIVLAQIIFYSWPISVKAQNVATAKEASNIIELRNVKEKGNAVSGEVVNKSSHPIRNITLLVQYHWLWRNEYHPGKNPPGRAAYVDLNKELSPGESVSFTYEPEPPLTNRTDGHFMPEVSIAAFSTVYQSQRTTSR
ncbi:MAG TPA: hypothetical protein VE131_02560 [Terriglobales bacterium]|nr:hypothetical protein [Terriglobales bacterium]